MKLVSEILFTDGDSGPTIRRFRVARRLAAAGRQAPEERDGSNPLRRRDDAQAR
jgi:hypothetical protein